MNTRELRKIQKKILKFPKNFKMEDFAMQEPCGTTCCIAGEAIVNRGGFMKLETPEDLKESGDMASLNLFGSGALRKELRKLQNTNPPAPGDDWGSEISYPSLGKYKRGQVLNNHEAGRLLLGLTSDQAERLFYETNWPDKYYMQYETAKTSRGRARAAANRIDHFIQTKGEE